MFCGDKRIHIGGYLNAILTAYIRLLVVVVQTPGQRPGFFIPSMAGRLPPTIDSSANPDSIPPFNTQRLDIVDRPLRAGQPGDVAVYLMKASRKCFSRCQTPEFQPARDRTLSGVF